MKKKLFIFAFFIMIFSTIFSANPTYEAIPTFDATKFAGKWYEIKRMDMFFERGMVGVTQEYTLQENGDFKIMSRGKKGGDDVSSGAKAKKTPIANFYKFSPSAFPLVSSPYNIIWFDKDYKYAIVAGKTTESLWYLSRTPEIPSNILKEMDNFVTNLGFDVNKLISGQ